MLSEPELPLIPVEVVTPGTESPSVPEVPTTPQIPEEVCEEKRLPERPPMEEEINLIAEEILSESEQIPNVKEEICKELVEPEQTLDIEIILPSASGTETLQQPTTEIPLATPEVVFEEKPVPIEEVCEDLTQSARKYRHKRLRTNHLKVIT